MHITQERIIRSARQYFEVQGLHKTRMEDIAHHADLSRQTLYKYFLNKKDIIDHIALHEMIAIHKQLFSRLRPWDSFPTKLTEVIIFSVERARTNPYIRAMIEDANQVEGYPIRNPSLYKWQVDKWSRFLKKARADEALQPDIDIASAVRWITMCQLLLMGAYSKLETYNLPLRPLVQRFIVKPLLNCADANSFSSPEIMPSTLAFENARLRELIATQALEIFQLQQQKP